MIKILDRTLKKLSLLQDVQQFPYNAIKNEEYRVSAIKDADTESSSIILLSGPIKNKRC